MGETAKEEEIDDELDRDDDLRRKIEQYNISNRASKEK